MTTDDIKRRALGRSPSGPLPAFLLPQPDTQDSLLSLPSRRRKYMKLYRTPPPGGWGCRRTGQAKQGCLRLSQCPPSFDEISFDLTVLLIRTQGQASLKKGSSILLCCLGILLYRVCLPSFLLCVLKPGVPCPFKRTFPGGGLEWARAVFSGSLLLSSPTVGLRSLENMASL